MERPDATGDEGGARAPGLAPRLHPGSAHAPSRPVLVWSLRAAAALGLLALVAREPGSLDAALALAGAALVAAAVALRPAGTRPA